MYVGLSGSFTGNRRSVEPRDRVHPSHSLVTGPSLLVRPSSQVSTCPRTTRCAIGNGHEMRVAASARSSRTTMPKAKPSSAQRWRSIHHSELRALVRLCRTCPATHHIW